MRSASDNPERFVAGAVFRTDREDPARLELESARVHHGGLLLKFAGVDDRTNAESLRGVTLFVAKEARRPLSTGEYWIDELIGLIARDPAGRKLGVVIDVVLGPQDRLVVETEAGGLVEVPFVAELVGEVSPAEGHVIVDAPPGLF